ncbi:AaceriADL383Wp [[Ashbya] aceris (nom. inval.)]|nr:AaceriADL383Wp [[Ashbya] aceris (nom. inval.)]
MRFTLRAHVSTVTDIKPLSLDVIPHLLSADTKGCLYLWNLITRRPIASLDLKAHVISIEVLGQDLYAVLARDNKLRFIRLQQESQLVRINGNACRELRSLEVVYEIPVNCLNFANFGLQDLGMCNYRLWCCNTMDAEAIDVYEFQLGDDQSFKRTFNAVKLFEPVTELSAAKHKFRFDKMGIVMRFMVAEDTVFCGFESGVVVGLRILNKTLQISYASFAHYPEPVLSLAHDTARRRVLSSSTTDRIAAHSIPTADLPILKTVAGIQVVENAVTTEETIPIPLKKIGHLAVLNDILLLTSWQGYVLALQDQKELLRYRRERNLISVDDSSNGQEETKKDKPWTNAGPIAGVAYSKDVLQLIPDKLRIGEKRRLEDFLERKWYITGYNDGTITVSQI